MDEARAAVEDLLQNHPEFSLSTAKLLATAGAPELNERWLDGLRKAGVKE